MIRLFLFYLILFFRFSFANEANDARLESCVRRGHELTATVNQLSTVMHSLRLKLHIAQYVSF